MKTILTLVALIATVSFLNAAERDRGLNAFATAGCTVKSSCCTKSCHSACKADAAKCTTCCADAKCMTDCQAAGKGTDSCKADAKCVEHCKDSASCDSNCETMKK